MAASHHDVFETDAAAASASSGWRREINPYLGYTANSGSWSLTTSLTTGQVLPYLTQSSSPATTDALSWTTDLDAGTWTLNTLIVKSSNFGKPTFTLDGTSFGTIDFYAASAAYQVVASLTGITVASPGNHTIKMTVSAKNGSSSNYYVGLQWMNFVRTA